MAPDDSSTGAESVCPHLGLHDDPSAWLSDPSPAHRCFSGRRPLPIGPDHQATYCLSDGYQDCPRADVDWNYPDDPPAGGRGRGRQDTVREWTRLDVPRALALGVGAELAIILLVLWLLSFAWGAANPAGGGVAAASPSDGDRPPSLSQPTPPAGSGPEPTAIPTAPRPSATPTIAPTPTATPAPAGRVYVVQPGDTLWSIASHNGVTTDELMKANGLNDRDFIWSGQRLTIP